jgi:hypothetical protein
LGLKASSDDPKHWSCQSLGTRLRGTTWSFKSKRLCTELSGRQATRNARFHGIIEGGRAGDRGRDAEWCVSRCIGACSLANLQSGDAQHCGDRRAGLANRTSRSTTSLLDHRIRPSKLRPAWSRPAVLSRRLRLDLSARELIYCRRKTTCLFRKSGQEITCREAQVATTKSRMDDAVHILQQRSAWSNHRRRVCHGVRSVATRTGCAKLLSRESRSPWLMMADPGRHRHSRDA